MAWQGTLKTAPAKNKTAVRWAGPSAAGPPGRAAFPLWVTVPYAIFVGIFLAVYWIRGESGYFLWFFDVALVGTLVALWFASRLAASMMALAVLLPAMAWNVSFLARAFGGFDPFSLAGYMFDRSIPPLIRGLSLLHVLLPPLLVWMVYRLGYDRRALAVQTLLAWAVLLAFQTPAGMAALEGPESLSPTAGLPQADVLAGLWLIALMLFYPLAVYLPAHFALRALFQSRPRTDAAGRLVQAYFLRCADFVRAVFRRRLR